MKIVILTLHLVAAGSAAAVEPLSQNPNWSAWLGCWQAQGAPANELVCVTPSDNGVRIATMIDGSVRDESRVIADGAKRPVQSVGCTGSERAYWSNDRRRVFLESDVACGASGRRTLRGLFAFVAPDEWISVQTATEGDSVATRVVRFTAVDSRNLPAGVNSFAPRTGFAEGLLTVDEAAVNEAVAHVGGEGVQEWMRLAGEPFQLGYQGQDRGHGSALEQVGRMSNPVVVREVVRVVERPVYVHDGYYDDYYYNNYYRWHYSPWGYHYSSWYWHRPVIVVHLPLYIHRNSHYRNDYWRYDRDRFDRFDRDDRNRGGRVTRGGYSSGRERAVPVSSEPNRARTQPQASEQRVTRSAEPREGTRESSRRGSESAAPSRSSGSNSSRASSSRGTSGSRPAVSRTARAR